MHHRPSAPPLSARLRGAGRRWLHFSRAVLRRRGGRLALGLLLSAVVTTVVLGVPVVSGSSAGTPSVTFDASASSSASDATEGHSPVVMGRDGKPMTWDGPPGQDAAPASGTDVVGATGSDSPDASEAGTGGGASGSLASGSPPSATRSHTAPGTTVPASTTAQTPTPTMTEAPPPAVPAALGDQAQVLALVNTARAEEGCGALVPDSALAGLAQTHSAQMRDTGLLGLGSLLDLGGRAATVAHGVADPATIVQGWLSDATDRAAILDCGLGSAGIGVTVGPDGSWWTQLLA